MAHGSGRSGRTRRHTVDGLTDMSKDGVLVKSSFWYTLGNFVSRTLVFLATPIYIRFLTKAQYGLYSNFASWLTILSVATGMNLQISIMRGRYDYGDNYRGYLKSAYVVILGLVSCLGIVYALDFQRISAFLMMDRATSILMFLYLLTFPAYTILTANMRAFFQIKRYVLMTALQVAATVISSIVLMLLWDNKLMALIVGQTVPMAIIGLVCIVLIFSRGGTMTSAMLKRAFKLGFPMIPHLLGGVLLSRSDRIMITHLRGLEENAYYSVAGNVNAILMVASSSLYGAFIPWLTGQLSEKDSHDHDTRVAANRHVILFMVLVIGLMLVSPEVILFFGGRGYEIAIEAMMPLLLGTFFNHLYVFYMNLQYYQGKTWGIVFSTLFVTLLNIALNFAFIPKYGFVAAAYTTLACYVLRYLIHLLAAYHCQMGHVYNNGRIFLYALVLVLTSLAVYWLYAHLILRYAVIGIYVVVGVVFLYKKRDRVKMIFSRSKMN